MYLFSEKKMKNFMFFQTSFWRLKTHLPENEVFKKIFFKKIHTHIFCVCGKKIILVLKKSFKVLKSFPEILNF